ncbi:unnamed protein product [Rotaria sp. Silwood1]|nr:unnamed protein product [Rotaria sp. Silwood1]CAF4848195.1 unnamed protein product [Rotaria sp. Silwood1]
MIPQAPVLFSGTLRYNLDPSEQLSDEQYLMTKQIEKKLGVDLDGDGVIGSKGRGHGGGSQSHGYESGGLVNQLENVTHTDFDGDGRIGNKPAYSSNYNQQHGQANFSNHNQYHGQPYHSSNDPFSASHGSSHYNPYDVTGGSASHFDQFGAGRGLINQFEQVAQMDLDGDGRIGNKPGHSSNFNPYGHGH